MTTPLPTNPDIDQLRRQAKELLRQARSGDAAAIDRLGTSADSGAALSLADAQRALASEYVYPSWPHLRQGVADARGRISGLRAARPAFDDKTRVAMRCRSVSERYRARAGAERLVL